MLKLRILFAILTFGAGAAVTIPFPNQSSLLSRYLQHRNVRQLPAQPESVFGGSSNVAFDSHGVPMIESGFGGAPWQVAGNDTDFFIQTGPQPSISGKILFYRPWERPPVCALMSAEANARYFEMRASSAGVYLAVVGSHFPPNSRIHIQCAKR